MAENKKRLNIAIPMELYTKVTDRGHGITEAIVEGLKLFLDPPTEQYESTIKELQVYNETLVKELESFKNPEILQTQNIRVQDLQEQQEARIKDLQEQNKVKDQLQEARIADLKEQIQTLNEQIKKKDSQIEDSNKNLFAQANSLYNLTNTKLLPENTENKKPWWRFW